MTSPPRFVATGLPNELVYQAGDTDRFPLTAFFEPGVPADIVVTATSPSTFVDLRTYGRVLDLKALESGSSVLSLHVAASGFRDTTFTIPLTVTGSICPPRGDRDLLAARKGDEWRFSYRDENVPEGAVTEGTLTFRFLEMTCVGGTRQWVAQYSLDASRTVAGVSAPIVQQGGLSLFERASNEVLLQTNVYQNISNQAVFQRFWTGTGDTAVLSTSTPCTGLNSPPSVATMTFEVGRGLVAESASCGSGPTLHRRQFVRLP